jgi:predicted transcriptional regulator of viral defense system
METATRRRAFDELVEVAAQQHGFLTTDDARDLGINTDYLRRLRALGKLANLWRGVYRVLAVPAAPHDDYFEATLWAGPGGVVVGEAALALWDLADVNPRVIEVAVTGGKPARHAKDNPQITVTTRRLDPAQIDEVHGVPVVRPEVAIRQAIEGGTDPELVRQAIANARGRGLIGELAEARLRVALDQFERTGAAR